MQDDQLTEQTSDASPMEDPDGGLRGRLDKLERDSLEDRRLTERRLILAELKVEAMRANMVDLDGLQFLDMTQVRLTDDYGIAGGPELIARQALAVRCSIVFQYRQCSTVKPHPSEAGERHVG